MRALLILLCVLYVICQLLWISLMFCFWIFQLFIELLFCVLFCLFLFLDLAYDPCFCFGSHFASLGFHPWLQFLVFSQLLLLIFVFRFLFMAFTWLLLLFFVFHFLFLALVRFSFFTSIFHFLLMGESTLQWTKIDRCGVHNQSFSQCKTRIIISKSQTFPPKTKNLWISKKASLKKPTYYIYFEL